MISYQSKTDIQNQVLNLLPHQIEECRECDQLPASLEEIIRHNYQATFVCYDKQSNSIEVGVENDEENSPYPEIKVYKIPLAKAVARIKKTFRTTDADLKFYGKILAGYGYSSKIEDVVLV